MIQSAEEFVQLRTSEIPEEYRRAAHDQAPESVWIDVIRKYPTKREWVAHNKTAPLTVLRILAEDESPRVRHVVAGVRRAGAEILWLLAKDTDSSVRYAVILNAKAPMDIIVFLTKDECEHVAERATLRLSKMTKA
jgi:hypothetical protein